MSEEEQAEFNEVSKTSEEFTAHVNEYKDLMAYVQASHKRELKAEFKELIDRQQQKPRTTAGKQYRLLPINRYWLGAAAAIVVLVVAFVAQWRGGATDLNDLYSQYYEPVPVHDITRTQGTTPEAIRLYKAGQYGEAIPLLQQMVTQNEYKIAEVYLGIAFIETGQLQQAKARFELVLTARTDPFNTQYAQWYLTMIAVKEGNTEVAKSYLELIIAEDGLYAEPATALLNDLH